MRRKPPGRYIAVSAGGEEVRAFVPAPLPVRPPIDWANPLREKFDQALLALGRLDSVSALLPDSSVFLYTYIRKEAVLSSQIEGTQSSLSDLLLFEMDQEPGVPLDDVQEVSNYVAALQHGLKRLGEGFPLSLRLIREIHRILLAKGRGSDRTPGEFRKSQNWIGGTRPGDAAFVPPPADQVERCMGELELFLHDRPTPTPPLVKAALAHAQFETIHPFLDGNGRAGRLLITLVLCQQKVLREPTLYLSLYFKAHRAAYYDLQDGIRRTGDWEAWLLFFAEAVIATAAQSGKTAGDLLELARRDRERIMGLGRAAASALLIHRALLERPLATAGVLADKTGLTPATVNRCLEHLENLKIVRELTEKKRNRLFSYAGYVRIMNREL